MQVLAPYTRRRSQIITVMYDYGTASGRFGFVSPRPVSLLSRGGFWTTARRWKCLTIPSQGEHVFLAVIGRFG